MKNKIVTRFCTECGSKMKYIANRKGQLFYIDNILATNNKWYYKEKFNPKTGKPFGAYVCPKFGVIITKGWFSSKETLNNHDAYSE